MDKFAYNSNIYLGKKLDADGVSRPASIELDSSVLTSEIVSGEVHHKVVISGLNNKKKLIQSYYFTKPLKVGCKISRGITFSDNASNVESNNIPHCDTRAKNNIRRLIYCNFSKYDKFLTLTFRNTRKFDIKNVKACNVRVKHFHDKLRKLFPSYKFIQVIEYQKRGAVHYHLLTNIPYIRSEDLEKIWKKGYARIGAIKDLEYSSNYLSKYMSKFDRSYFPKGLRRFSTSENLDKPVVCYGDEATQIMSDLYFRSHPSYTKHFDVSFVGDIDYSEYIFDRVEWYTFERGRPFKN